MRLELREFSDYLSNRYRAAAGLFRRLSQVYRLVESRE